MREKKKKKKEEKLNNKKRKGRVFNLVEQRPLTISFVLEFFRLCNSSVSLFSFSLFTLFKIPLVL